MACAADKEKKPTRSHQSGIELIVPGGEATFCLLPDRNRDGVVFEADVTWRRCRRRRAEKQLRWEEKERWEALRVRTEAPGVGAEDVAPSLCTDYRGLGVVLNPRARAPRYDIVVVVSRTSSSCSARTGARLPCAACSACSRS